MAKTHFKRNFFGPRLFSSPEKPGQEGQDHAEEDAGRHGKVEPEITALVGYVARQPAQPAQAAARPEPCARDGEEQADHEEKFSGVPAWSNLPSGAKTFNSQPARPGPIAAERFGEVPRAGCHNPVSSPQKAPARRRRCDPAILPATRPGPAAGTFPTRTKIRGRRR